MDALSESSLNLDLKDNQDANSNKDNLEYRAKSDDQSFLNDRASTDDGNNIRMGGGNFDPFTSSAAENSFMDSFTKFVSTSNAPDSSNSSSEDDEIRLLKEKKLLPPAQNPTQAPASSISSSNSSQLSAVPSTLQPNVRSTRPIKPTPGISSASSSSASSSDSDSEGPHKKRPKKKAKFHQDKKIKKVNPSTLKKFAKPQDNSALENGHVEMTMNETPSIPFVPQPQPPEKIKRPKGRPRLDPELRKKTGNRFPKFLSREEYKGPSFLQNGPCFEVGNKLSKCRECRLPSHQRNKKMLNIFCRFYHFRKVRMTKHGITSAGFAEPNDCTEEDLALWMPATHSPPPDLDIETAKFLLTHVGDQFCDLISQEQEAKSLHSGTSGFVAWKRLVAGVREMCDVCETTIFNSHWVCRRCGFVVCIDCYKTRKSGMIREEDEHSKERDEFQWLFCTNRQVHDQSKLMLTEIVAGSALIEIGRLLHEVRQKWNIPAYCKCPLNTSAVGSSNATNKKNGLTNNICKQLISSMKKAFPPFKPQLTERSSASKVNEMEKTPSSNQNVNGCTQESIPVTTSSSNNKGNSHLAWLAAGLDSKENRSITTGPVTLLELKDHLRESEASAAATRKSIASKSTSEILDEIAEYLLQKEENKKDENGTSNKRFHHFMKRFPSFSSNQRGGNEPLPIRICTLSESTLLYPDVPHAWLCDGKLLLLKDPLHPQNLELFQEQWKRGQPVLVSGVSNQLDMSLWHPDGFARDFGEITNDLVNCRTGTIIPDLPMKKFWEGFENFPKRLKDENGEYMLLKLKDWPPGEDFSEMLPSRFQDLMQALPLAPYTHRDGKLNLAGRLPSCFVRPDLGPKMYNAYGSAKYPTKGTTNLHLDVSDAVNVMVYVGVPDENDESHVHEALKAIDEGGCDSVTRRRVREKGVRPGALWHIYNARDADKIRQLLTKVAVERGEKLEAHHDPIHDQSWYLEEGLRRRLYREYGVQGYAIAQCLGDAVFIPAGAPHQVRNLHSCIKVAEDFVSPENIGHCFTLTQEFRDLSDTHTNHEDKLQIKNIIYHTVRDALAHLLAASPSGSEAAKPLSSSPSITAEATLATNTSPNVTSQPSATCSMSPNIQVAHSISSQPSPMPPPLVPHSLGVASHLYPPPTNSSSQFVPQSTPVPPPLISQAPPLQEHSISYPTLLASPLVTRPTSSLVTQPNSFPSWTSQQTSQLPPPPLISHPSASSSQPTLSTHTTPTHSALHSIPSSPHPSMLSSSYDGSNIASPSTPSLPTLVPNSTSPYEVTPPSISNADDKSPPPPQMADHDVSLSSTSPSSTSCFSATPYQAPPSENPNIQQGPPQDTFASVPSLPPASLSSEPQPTASSPSVISTKVDSSSPSKDAISSPPVEEDIPTQHPTTTSPQSPSS